MKKLMITSLAGLIVFGGQLMVAPLYASTVSSVSKTSDAQNPVNMLNDSIVRTQQTLVKEAKVFQENPAKLIALIDANIVPHLSTTIIAQIILGKQRWREASKADQDQFIAQLTKMLAYTYASTIAKAGDYEVRLNPFANDSWKHERLIYITGSIINLTNKSSSAINIYLLKDKLGDWKIYDMSVEGVSILKNLKAQFEGFKTLKAVNEAIEKKNVKLEGQ